ncbi:hypothetical protein MYX78_00165 [Acidobacteria bacterium AH-259-G07]|nr:hypothetical protein [Acidobacteria bacterium AH-259-G07]
MIAGQIYYEYYIMPEMRLTASPYGKVRRTAGPETMSKRTFSTVSLVLFFAIVAQAFARPEPDRNFPVLLCIPSIDDTSGIMTGIALLNSSGEDARVQLIYRNNEGNDVGFTEFTVTARTQFAAMAQGVFGESLKGYIEIRAGWEGDIHAFYLRLDAKVETMDGAVATTYREPWRFQVPQSKADQLVTLYFVNGADMSRRDFDAYRDVIFDIVFYNSKKEKTILIRKKIKAGGRGVINLIELSREVGVEDQMREGGYIEISPGKAYIAAIVEVRDQETMLIIPEATRDYLVGNELTFPQLAVGGGSFTEVDFIAEFNWAPVTITAFRDDGTVLASKEFRSVDRVWGRLSDLLDIVPEGTTTGYLVADRVRFGSVRYGFENKTIVNTQYNRPTDTLYFGHVANAVGFWTGLALLNQNPGPTEITIEIFEANGVKSGETTFTLKRNEKIARLLTELVPETDGQAGGYVKVTSSLPIMGLEIFGRYDLASMAVVPPN